MELTQEPLIDRLIYTINTFFRVFIQYAVVSSIAG